MRILINLLLLCPLLGSLGIFSYSAEETTGSPHHLLCEYLVNPLGLDEPAPRLFWRLPEEFQKQTAYQLLVASSPDLLRESRADVLDTGKVDSDQSIHVVYSGPPLRSNVRYYWTVRVWDEQGRPSPFAPAAFWQMGLLNASDWKAQWIGLEGALPDNAAPHVGYHSQLEKSAEHTKWVQIDLGQSRRVDRVRLYPCQPFDYSKNPGFLFPVRFRVDVSNDPEFQTSETVWDLTSGDFPNPGAAVVEQAFPPRKSRYVRLTVTRLAHRDADNYAFALAELECLSGEQVISQGRPAASFDTIESDVWSLRHVNDGINETREARFALPSPSPMLRKTFTLNVPVRRATLYATALGLYEARINGLRVGKNLLAPEWTDYHQRIQVQAYDVTGMLRQGENVIGAMLGEGWYAGMVGLLGPRQYGSRLGFLAQLEIECGDGTTRTVVTGPSWRITDQGPIRGSDIIRGETYDARLEMPGWDTPGFDDSAWQPVSLLPPGDVKLVAQPNEPIQITQELSPLNITEPTPGVYVFDLGQNMVGWCRLRIRGEAGQRIEIQHGEMLNPDGTVYTQNLRDHNRRDPVQEYQKDVFIGRGGEAIFEPHFTYHGFRYVEVRGLTRKPSRGDMAGCVFHSAAPLNGTFECSDPMLNQLMKNIVWTKRGNLHSTPTDCPQRDERLGWMGDAQAFSQTACYLMNLGAFYTKWCQDIRDAQADDGRFADFSPNPAKSKNAFLAAPAWADAGVIIPWRMYVNYGDSRILERHYDAAKRWVEYVRSQSPEGIWIQGRGNDYGDWLNGDQLILENWPKKGADTPREIFATAFYAHSTEILSKMAKILGKNDEAEQYARLAGVIKAAFCKRFVQPDGRITSDNQSVYGLALHFDLLPEDQRPLAVQHLLRKIEEYNQHISTGIQATHRMMLELVRWGQADTAYRLLMNRTIPSWGYMIDQGATTIWERWDGWVEGRGFQNPGMNSFNHYAFGSVGEWMFRHILGIQPDPEHPAYRHFVIHPIPGGGLTYAKGTLDTLYGTIRISWKREDPSFEMECAIPPNTTATVYVPSSNPEKLTETNGKLIAPPRYEKGCFVLELSPGTYHWITELK
ncbi:MAG: family 78 glycoside hydrolase catalytic domain [Candidatus Omnitrophica bacterium]|nr:family 78 glycoside hydrolase catalytic domain [Candidatus Omnitrophota bacterium]